ncbi:hypothetical protein F5Y15DRAFT_326957 [Xylariaceae sp. FL0016]|nr:hypothetical protein F5Y15DRAFT_326957 [Xylariaceae sp. FL0016]
MAVLASHASAAVVPAQLGFLAIFNPSLGTTDETIDDQIVYYASVNTQSQKRRHRSRGRPTDNVSQEERNERLRQIGLAQGMVDFSRGFANGESVDTIETEKSRVILRELEPGWWILASIDLTKIPLPPRLGSPAAASKDEQAENYEYTSRELKPAVLLMQDLLRAHSVFLLHHGFSLSSVFIRSRRPKFVSLLSRYWDLFLSTWDVMLHGNPVSNVFGGIKIAACGELGIGVGEEDRGSGEREVLEGFVDRVEGLVDLVVSKFGPTETDKSPDSVSTQKWLGTAEEPGAEDGAIFLGVGALSRKSVRDITYWMEDLYTWGEDAYGVKESPTSNRQSRRSRKNNAVHQDTPGRLVSPAGDGTTGQESTTKPSGTEAAPPQEGDGAADEGGMNKFMNYLKMGYGTHWTLGSSGEGEDQSQIAAENTLDHQGQPGRRGQSSPEPVDSEGHFLVGMTGGIEEASASEDVDLVEAEEGSRVRMRTLTVELDDSERPETEMAQDLGSHDTELTATKSGGKDLMDPHSTFDSQDRNKSKKMRVVVYVQTPFIYTFLFKNRTDSLAWDTLYKSLHYQLAPLRKSLAASTTYRPGKLNSGAVASHIFDLIWDPKAITINSTIPSIPSPAELLRDGAQPLWSRAEAINTHNQLLNTYVATLTDYSQLERTNKTNRGWWVVWTRIMEAADTQPSQQADSNSEGKNSDGPTIPSLQQSDSQDSEASMGAPATSRPSPKPKVSKEIFLIRRAGETSGLKGVGGSFAEGGWANGASRLAQGIGVDTHKYIEGLLSLGR